MPTNRETGGLVRGSLALARSLFTRNDERTAAQRATLLALVIRIANAGLAYAAQVVLARLMGQYEYGIFAFTWVWFLAFASVGTLGFGDSPVRFIPQLRERGEPDHLRGFLRTAVFAIVGGAVLFAAVIFVGVALAAPYIENAYVFPMVLMAAILLPGGLQAFLDGVGRSYFWTVPALVPVYLLRHGLLLLFMVAAVVLGYEATAANALICLMLAVVASLIWQATAILRRLRRVLPPGPRAYRAGEWISGSIPFSVMFGTNFLFAFADVLVLSFFVTPEQLAVYFAATRVMQVVSLIPYAASVGSAQVFSARHTAGDWEGLNDLTHTVSFWSFAVACVVGITIVLIGEFLLGLFGPNFGAGVLPLTILAAGIVAGVAAGPGEVLLNMTGHSQLTAITSAVALVLNVALNIALIVPFGVVGAAVATSIAIVLRAVWLALATRSRLGISCWAFAARPSLASLRALVEPPIPEPAE